MEASELLVVLRVVWAQYLAKPAHAYVLESVIRERPSNCGITESDYDDAGNMLHSCPCCISMFDRGHDCGQCECCVGKVEERNEGICVGQEVARARVMQVIRRCLLSQLSPYFASQIPEGHLFETHVLQTRERGGVVRWSLKDSSGFLSTTVLESISVKVKKNIIFGLTKSQLRRGLGV